MSEDAKVSVAVGEVHVDNAVVQAARPIRGVRQVLIDMTPLLSILITAVALVVSSSIQVWQNRVNAVQKLDSDWRDALTKISEDKSTALVGALEMQSFNEERHKRQARSIAATLLPRIDDPAEFDVALAVLVTDTDERTQADLTSIARHITNDLEDRYEKTKKPWVGKPVPANEASLEDFIADPGQYFDEQTHSEDLKLALAEIWKLDTATHSLSLLWTGQTSGAQLVAPIRPAKMDLSGILFLNGNFQGVDFHEAAMDSSEFVGNCIVDKGKVPATVKLLCSAGQQQAKR